MKASTCLLSSKVLEIVSGGRDTVAGAEKVVGTEKPKVK